MFLIKNLTVFALQIISYKINIYFSNHINDSSYCNWQ